jgi:hypothetical protein
MAFALDPAVLADLLEAAAAHASYDPPATWYLAATSDEPTDLVHGTELSGDGYSRCAVSPSVVMALVSGAWKNGSDILFDPASGVDWTEVLGIECYDDPTAGNRQWYGGLDTGVSVVVGNAMRIPAGNITIEWPS